MARIAQSDIVALVDADSLIHPDTFNAIDRTLWDDVIIGATGIPMSRWSLGIGVSLVLLYPVIYALGAVWLATNHEALREYAQMYWYDDRA